MSSKALLLLPALLSLVLITLRPPTGLTQERGLSPPPAAQGGGGEVDGAGDQADAGDVAGQDDRPSQSAEERPGPGSGPAGDGQGIVFNFRGASLDSVIEAIAEVGQFNFIKAADVGGTVTVVNRQRLSSDEALNVLNEVLRVRGSTLIRSGQLVTIVPLSEGGLYSTTVLKGDGPEDVPDTAEIIHWVEPLRYVDAGRVASDLAKLMPSYGNLAANADSNTLIITDTATNVKRLLTIIKSLDNPQVTTATVRVIHLENADALSLVDPLNKLFAPPETRQSAGARMARFRMMMAQRSGQTAPQNLEPSERQQVRVVADERTNSIIVSAATEMLTVIEQLVKELDAEAVGALLSLRVYLLEHADSDEVAAVVSNLFAAESTNQRVRQLQDQVRRLRFQRGQAAEGGATAELKEMVKVASDARTNSVIVMATEDNLQIIGQLIAQLDDEAAATPQTVAIIPLENADPADVAQILADILTTDEQQVRVRGPASRQSQQRRRLPQFRRSSGRTGQTRTPTSRQRRTTGSSGTQRGQTGGGSRRSGGPRSEATPARDDAVALGPVVEASRPTLYGIPGLGTSVAASPDGPALLAQERRLDRLTGGGPPTSGPRAQPARLSRPEFEEGESITITYDERTGALIVSAPEGTLGLIRDVVTRLDEDPAEKFRSVVYHLNNADCVELADVLNTMFTAAVGVPGIAAELRGEILVVPDVRTNSIIITSAPRNFDLILPIVEDLDMTPPQVLIQVLLAEVTMDDSVDLGLDFATWDQLGFAEGQPPRAFGVGGTSLFYSIINRNLEGFLNFLQSRGKLDILSRPQILASDNQIAEINVGQEVPFIRQVQITEAGNTISTIEYEDIGILLSVTPHINPAGLVNLEIQAENSNIAESTIPLSEQFNAAVFNKELASTVVAIEDGETIVIGGLIENTVEERVNKIPILGDIPLLGDLLFKNRTEKEVKKELLIILTPRVVRTAEELAALSREEKARVPSLQRDDFEELAPPGENLPEQPDFQGEPPFIELDDSYRE